MPQAPISVTCRRPRRDVAVLDIAGDLTGAAEDALMSAYAEAGNSGTRAVVLNFNDLGYMNSSGIGLLVTLLIRVQRSKQKLFAVGLTDHYQQIFELTRLNEAIIGYPDERAALAAA